MYLFIYYVGVLPPKQTAVWKSNVVVQRPDTEFRVFWSLYLCLFGFCLVHSLLFVYALFLPPNWSLVSYCEVFFSVFVSCTFSVDLLHLSDCCWLVSPVPFNRMCDWIQLCQLSAVCCHSGCFPPQCVYFGFCCFQLKDFCLLLDFNQPK